MNYDHDFEARTLDYMLNGIVGSKLRRRPSARPLSVGVMRAYQKLAEACKPKENITAIKRDPAKSIHVRSRKDAINMRARNLSTQRKGFRK
jgi:hypothetical protein